MAVLFGFAAAAVHALTAQDSLQLHLKGAGKVQYGNARYKCDATGVALGLPAGVFTVRYVQAGENSLAILPLHGRDRVFARLMSADGERYGADSLVWWIARVTSFAEDEGPNSKYSTCKPVN